MNNLTEDQVLSNKNRFLELLGSIERQGAMIDSLCKYLCETDFFEAPASTHYHMSCKGGLCAHSLNVYDNMVKLYKTIYGVEELDVFVHESIKIVSLLHDISKINTYKVGYRNKKVYSDSGSKTDECGRFDWVSVPSYETRDVSERFILGNHEQNSEYIARCYLPLTVEESSAILHHMGGMSWDSAKDNIGEVYNKYSLALLLYMSDMLSSYISEK